MKRKLLSAAISSLALAGFSQTSQATPYDFYLAGSSAQDAYVMNEIYNLCITSTFTYFIDDNFGAQSSGYGNNYKAYTCTVDSTKVTSLNSGDVITFHKTNLGGSAMGVAPLFEHSTVAFLNTSGACTTTGGKAVGSSTTTVPTQVCSASLASDFTTTYLDAGVADVNPTMFQGVNTTTAYNPTNGAVIKAFGAVTSVPSTVTLTNGPALIWAVPVSLNLYTALQAAQGLLNTALTADGVTLAAGNCTAGAYGYTSGSVSAADGCMPSFTKPQLSTLISGTVNDWSSVSFNGVNVLDVATAYDTAKGLTGSAAIVPTTGSAVVFCQRTAGSGTAASQYAYFLNQPANQNTTGVTPAASSIANNYVGATGGNTVYSIADGGNMENCLLDFATGGTSAKNYAGHTINTSGNYAWAIGQQSSDKNVSKSKAYRFIKINGVAPTLANAFTGAYDFVNESSWQVPNTPRNSQVGAIINQLITNVTNPATVYTDLDAFTGQDFGTAGFIGTFAQAYNLNSAYTLPNQVVVTYPVTPWSHAVSGNLDNGMFEMLDGNSATMP